MCDSIVLLLTTCSTWSGPQALQITIYDAEATQPTRPYVLAL
jgi:hypothetical protein